MSQAVTNPDAALVHCEGCGRLGMVVPNNCPGFAPAPAPMARGEIHRDRDEWLFVDHYGSQWRIRRTDDPGMPLTITLEKKQ